MVLICGNHRLEAAKRVGLTKILAIVHEDLTESQKYQIALASNANAADAMPETFVDHAELVWRLLDGRTQQQVADVVGWSRSKVRNFALLSGICSAAWDIVGTTFDGFVPSGESGPVPEDVTVVTKSPFTEGLLRPLSSLYGHQQYQLVKDLARGKDRRGHAYTKAKFNAGIVAYQSLNAALEH
jgi:hypothetical protein